MPFMDIYLAKQVYNKKVKKTIIYINNNIPE